MNLATTRKQLFEIIVICALGFCVCSQLIGLVFKMVFSKIFDEFEENLMTISHFGILNCSK